LKLNYNNLRESFHDVKSQSTSFTTGIKLLKDRMLDDANYKEIIALMDASLEKTNEYWKRLKKEIDDLEEKVNHPSA